jgi:hypothetical protein
MEDDMKKLLVAGLTTAMLMGGVNIMSASAQTAAAPPAAQPEKTTGPADNQIANDVDARIADLKAKLRLTTDQEKNWPGLQSELRDNGIAQLKISMEEGNRPRRRDREDKDQADRPNDIALMRSVADSLTAQGASLKKLADAAEPLYANLDDHQRHELFEFLRTDFEPHRR